MERRSFLRNLIGVIVTPVIIKDVAVATTPAIRHYTFPNDTVILKEWATKFYTTPFLEMCQRPLNNPLLNIDDGDSWTWTIPIK